MVDGLKNNYLIMFLFLFLFSLNIRAADLKCEAGKVLVRSQYVTDYVRKDGTRVSGYYKKQYCRLSLYKGGEISFLSRKPEHWPLDEKFNEWSDKDIETTLGVIESLPEIFKRQLIKSFHRGAVSTYPKNPAAALVIDHAIILYDDFFNGNTKARVLAHEIAHLWYWNLNTDQKKEFAAQAGWTYNQETKTRSKSKRPIYADSQDGPSEDFANNAEAYFYDNNLQKDFDALLQKYFNSLIEEKK